MFRGGETVSPPPCTTFLGMVYEATGNGGRGRCGWRGPVTLRSTDDEPYLVLLAQQSEILRVTPHRLRPAMEATLLPFLCRHHQMRPWELLAIMSPLPEITD